MANSADPDLDLHCLQRQGISGLSRTRVKIIWQNLYSEVNIVKTPFNIVADNILKYMFLI